MPTYQIEMLWTCRVCGFEDNRGLQKHCTNCGKPKDERDVERFPDDLSEANALTGEKRRKALAGPDWKCKFCGTLQNSLGHFCQECGCDRETGEKPWEYGGPEKIVENVETGVKKTFPTSPKRPRRKARARAGSPAANSPAEASTGEFSGTDSPAEGIPLEFVPGTGGYRNPPAVRESKPAHGSEKSAKSRRANGIAFPLPVLGIVAGLVVLGLVLWLLFRTRIVDASVTAVSWQHDVIVDRYEVHRKEGWSASPDAFDVQDEGRRLHHYDRVKVGSHEESYLESYTCGETCTTVPGSCYTTPRTCTSNQNGTATCTGGDRVCSPDTKSCTPKTCTRTAWRTVDDYENQPRYRTWYSWKVWEWGYNRTVRASGSTVETRWPSEEDLRPNRLAPGERERHRRQGSYSVTFSGDGDSWTIHPSTEDDFRRFSPGSRFKLRVGIARGVTVLGADGSSSEY